MRHNFMTGRGLNWQTMLSRDFFGFIQPIPNILLPRADSSC